MNFGDILDDWEKKYSHSRSKKLEPGHYEKKYKKRKRTVESTCDITQIVKKYKWQNQMEAAVLHTNPLFGYCI